MKKFYESVIATSTFSSNIYFWKQDGYFDTAGELKPLLHTWSLSIEEQFYILYPIIILLIWRFCKKYLNFILLSIFCLSFVIAQWASIAKPVAAFYLLPMRTWEILLGGLCSIYLENNKNSISNSNRKFLSIIGFIMILGSIFLFNENVPAPGILFLFPTLGTAFFIVFARKDDSLIKFLSNKYLTRIGLLSYSAYLWHQPIFAFFRVSDLNIYYEYAVPFLILITFLLAFFTFKYIEEPLRVNKFNKDKVSFKLDLSISILGLISFTTIAALARNFYLYPFLNKSEIYLIDTLKDQKKKIVIKIHQIVLIIKRMKMIFY